MAREALERARDALIRSTAALQAAVSGEDPVALATALNERVETVDWLRAHGDEVGDDVRDLLRRVARSDVELLQRAAVELDAAGRELARLRRARGSLRKLAARDTTPRFVSRRA